MSAKPFKSYVEQLQIFQDRGLTVADPAKAEHILKHFSYYRLSAYRFPFQSATDQFIPGTDFEDIWQLYLFDRKLRHLVSEACKSLEISVRARWAHEFSQVHGAQAYEDPNYFQNRVRHTEHLQSLDRELNRSHEIFVDHYRSQYGLQRPPIWAACEVTSFGLLSKFYENMSGASLKKKIAKTYEINSHTLLTSLLTHTAHVRNLCAHHARLWNRSFVVTLTLPDRNPRKIVSALNTSPAAERKIYNTLVMLAHVSEVIHQSTEWKARIKAHLETLNRPDHSEMGFPSNWQSLSFWNI